MKMLFAHWDASNKENYPYLHWYGPLKRISNEIIIFDPKKIYFRYGKKSMNSKFIDIIKKEKPNYLFLGVMHDEFYLETFNKVRKVSPETKIINFFSDDDWRFDNYSRYISAFFDFCINCQKDSRSKEIKDGLNNFYFMDLGFDEERYKKMHIDKIYDISFVGGPTKERIDNLKFLINEGLKVNIWGGGWNILPEFKKYYKGYAKDIVKIINQSKICVGFLKQNSGRIQVKGRISEVASCGTFQIVTDNEETKKDFKENIDVAYFKDEKDLLNKIKYYLENEKVREQMAKRSYNIARKYSWGTQFSKFFKRIKKLPIVPRKIPHRTSVALCINNSTVCKGTFDKVVHIKNNSIEEINKVLSNMSEDYLCIIDRNSSFLKEAPLFKDIAFDKGADIVMNDFSVRTNLLGEIFVMGTDDTSIDRFKVVNLFPLSSFSFSKNFIKNNKNIIIKFIQTGKIDYSELNGEIRKISYPLLIVRKLDINNINKLPLFILHNYEINLYNLLYDKRYLSLVGYSIALLVYSLLENKHFIFNRLMKDIKRNDEYIKNF